MLLLRPDARATPLHDLFFEFKLVKPEDLGDDAARLDALMKLPAVSTALDEAATQARRYRSGLVARYGELLRLRSYAVVAVSIYVVVERWEAFRPR